MSNQHTGKRPNKFSAAPRDLVSPSYFVDVAAGEITPDPMAWPAFGGERPKAEDYPDRKSAYRLGYGQGWECELGGRLERPTPPVGMPRKLLPSFASGVLDGAALVQGARSGSGVGVAVIEEDPWADLDADIS